jgi:hypothetical protein
VDHSKPLSFDKNTMHFTTALVFDINLKRGVNIGPRKPIHVYFIYYVVLARVYVYHQTGNMLIDVFLDQS